MQMPFGNLSDRIRRKNVITIGSLFFALGLALAAVATNIYLLILARAMQGIGFVGGRFLYNLISVPKLFICCSILFFVSWLYRIFLM